MIMIGGTIVVSPKDIRDIESLRPDEQKLVISLVHSLLEKRETQTEAQKWFAAEREQCVNSNPMSMEEIDKIIHEED
jgi:hypothetical protein